MIFNELLRLNRVNVDKTFKILDNLRCSSGWSLKWRTSADCHRVNESTLRLIERKRTPACVKKKLDGSASPRPTETAANSGAHANPALKCRGATTNYSTALLLFFYNHTPFQRGCLLASGSREFGARGAAGVPTSTGRWKESSQQQAGASAFPRQTRFLNCWSENVEKSRTPAWLVSPPPPPFMCDQTWKTFIFSFKCVNPERTRVLK